MRGVAAAGPISFSQPSRQAVEVDPGRQKQEGAVGHAARRRADCRLEVPISSKLSARNSSPKPSIQGLSSNGSSSLRRGVAAGEAGAAADQDAVRPPSSAIHCGHLCAQRVLVVAQAGPVRSEPAVAWPAGQFAGKVEIAGAEPPPGRARVRTPSAARRRSGWNSGRRLAHAASVSSFSSSAWCSRGQAPDQCIEVASERRSGRSIYSVRPFRRDGSRDPALRIVVGADALAAVAAADLQASRVLRLRGFALGALRLDQRRLQPLHRLVAVRVLRALGPGSRPRCRSAGA